MAFSPSVSISFRKHFRVKKSFLKKKKKLNKQPHILKVKRNGNRYAKAFAQSEGLPPENIMSLLMTSVFIASEHTSVGFFLLLLGTSEDGHLSKHVARIFDLDSTTDTN